jgi:hypothetical protein
MTVPVMLADYLRQNGCDGLYNDESDPPCGCHLSDLIPCGEPYEKCVAARRGDDGMMYPVDVTQEADHA